MNADKARPLAAYILVSLVCAAVMAAGLRSDPLGAALGTSPDRSRATPAAGPPSVVPGTVLRARSGASATTTVPVGLPDLDAAVATATARAVARRQPAEPVAGTGRPARPSDLPSIVPQPDRPAEPTTSAGEVETGSPGQGLDKGKNKGKDNAQDKGHGKGHGKGKGRP